MAVIEAIQTVYLEADTATVQIDSIPGTYEHLQLRMSHRGSYYTTGTGVYMVLGSTTTGYDTGPNYNGNWIYGGGSSASGYRQNGQAKFEINTTGTENPSENYIPTVINFYDYANTNKRKTIDWSNGKVPQASQYNVLGSGFWDSPFVLDRIQLTTYSGSLVRGSHFTLYGLNSS